jgi:predicted nucleic acid-binding protein
MMRILLDSVILIDHLNGVTKATEYLRSIDFRQFAISVITRTEILVGVPENEMDVVKALLDQYHLIPIDRDASDTAASLRREHGWKLPDAFQAALCVRHGLRLATRNTKDFNPERFDFVTVPYVL